MKIRSDTNLAQCPPASLSNKQEAIDLQPVVSAPSLMTQPVHRTKMDRIEGLRTLPNAALGFGNKSEAIPATPDKILETKTQAAAKFLQSFGWGYNLDRIVDPKCTLGNCHGLTFGQGEQDFISIESPEEFLEYYHEFRKNNPSTRVLVGVATGFSMLRVAHTATEVAENQWKQTLIDGPVFLSSAQDFSDHYKEGSYVLPDELSEFEALASRVQSQAFAREEMTEISEKINSILDHMQCRLGFDKLSVQLSCSISNEISDLQCDFNHNMDLDLFKKGSDELLQKLESINRDVFLELVRKFEAD